MTDDAPTAKRSKMPILIGMVVGLAGAGGGYYLTAGTGGGNDRTATTKPATAKSADDVAFVPLDPMIVSVGSGGSGGHLRFNAQLEVAKGAEGEVRRVMPRIVDVLNGYLRAVEKADLEERTALVRLRAQMLRRVQIITGPNAVRDLLVMEFLLS